MTEEEFKKFLEKVEEIKKGKNFDLSLEEDLSIAVMNLISLEEHFFFTGEKTGKEEYFSLLGQTREIRKELLSRMIPAHEGETWCVSKHLLAATMRLMEVGTKYQSDGKKDEAKKVFDQANKIYGLFWALRLKLMNTDDLKKIPDEVINVHDKEGRGWTSDDIVKKLINCCDE